MGLSDYEIFQCVCDRNRDQTIEEVFREYAQAKALNAQMERIAQLESLEGLEKEAECPKEAAPEPEAPLKKRYTRRSLKVKPEEAIGDKEIACAICGQKFKTLTARHIAAHGLDVAEYRKLCGYPGNMPLMAKEYLASARRRASRMQAARMEKKAEREDA